MARSKPDLVYSALRAEILSGVLRPRERIVATQVAVRLGVSEIPVREALKRLQAEDLVTVVPNSGAFVADLTPTLILELFLMRSVLEGLAVRTACPRLTRDDRERLRALHDRMAACADGSEPERFAQLNREFHGILYEASPYGYLKKNVADLMHRTEWSVTIFTLQPDYAGVQVADHARMLACIEAGDADGLEAVMREHLTGSAERLQKLVGQGVALNWSAAAATITE